MAGPRVTDKHARIVTKNYVLKTEVGTQVVSWRALIDPNQDRSPQVEEVRRQVWAEFIERYGHVDYFYDGVHERIIHDGSSVIVEVLAKRDET